MIINQAVLQSIYVGFKTLFNQGIQEAKPLWQEITTEVPSNTRSEEYKWLGKIPRLREWIGDRVVQNLAAYGFTIVNKDWEATVAVDRNDIEDDTIGIYKSLILALGNSAAMHPDELIFELLLAGFSGFCYDGQYFFDSDHKDGSGPIQSNVSTAPLSATAYGPARAQMMSLKDEHGRALSIVPNLLVVPPQLEAAGLEILQAERNANGATNIYRNSARLLTVPQLSDHPTKWFLFDTSKPVKPLLFQRRRAPEFQAKDNPDDDNVFMRKEYMYGTDCRDNAGFGLWQMAYGSTGTG